MATKRKPQYKRRPTFIKLTERDEQIIHHVYRNRLLNAQQITALVEGSNNGIIRRLGQLYHAGYLDRIRYDHNAPRVYGLAMAGAHLLAERFDLPITSINWTTKNREAKQLFVEHTLGISQTVAVASCACKKRELTFIPTAQIIANRPKKPAAKDRALAWPVAIKKSSIGFNRNYQFHLHPDKAFGFGFPDGSRTFFFLEYDRATMPTYSTNPYRSSFFKKIVGYVESWRQKLYQPNFGFNDPRILTITTSGQRINNIIDAQKRFDPRGKGFRMFLFATREVLDLERPERFLQTVWINGRGEKTSLLD